MNLTTDELVANVIDAMTDDKWQDENGYGWLLSHLRPVSVKRRQLSHSEVFSVALNDETRDVRFVECVTFNDGSDPLAFEVFPVTVLRTEYRRK